MQDNNSQKNDSDNLEDSQEDIFDQYFSDIENSNSIHHSMSSPANLFDRVKLAQPEKFSMKKIPGVVGKNPDVAAIVLAGGNGSRLRGSLYKKHNQSKQLIKMSGKPVLTWSMDSFDAVSQIGLIVVVCPEKDFEKYIDEVIDPFAFQTPILMAPAGDTRQESAFSGLDLIPEKFKYVIVHDGARPLVPPSVIKHIINVLKGNPDIDGAVCAHRCIDTLKVVEDDCIIGTPDRDAFWMVQTPQVFVRKVYKEAHMAALADGFIGSDDASLIERIGGCVKVVEGRRNNIKLTVPEDYLILASVLQTLKIEHGSEYNI